MDPFDVFEAAHQAPQNPALVHAGGTLSYAALANFAQRALGWLNERLAPDAAWPAAPVAVLAAPTVEQVAMTYALISRGMPVLPVHPRFTPAERAELLRRVGTPLLVEEGWSRSPVAADAGARALAIAPNSDDVESPLALVQTSGSSGRARIAVLSRRAFGASFRAHTEHLGWRRGDRWLLALPFAHIGGLSILTRCLAARSTVVLASDPNGVPGAVRSDNTGVIRRALQRDAVSLLSLVPTQLERLLAEPTWQSPKNLRAVLVGGAAVADSSLAAARLRGLPVLATYGMTETCSQICTRSLRAGSVETGVGRPLEGVELKIEDDEILVRGPTLFSGYWGQPEAYSPSTWFPTGDLGRFDASGSVVLAGRRGDLIITGGENVHPNEIERALNPIMPTRRFCVFGRDDEVWGQQIALAIEGATDPRLIERIAQFAGAHLASFKRPRAVVFLEQLPEQGPGKVSRPHLKNVFADLVRPISYPKS